MEVFVAITYGFYVSGSIHLTRQEKKDSERFSRFFKVTQTGHLSWVRLVSSFCHVICARLGQLP